MNGCPTGKLVSFSALCPHCSRQHYSADTRQLPITESTKGVGKEKRVHDRRTRKSDRNGQALDNAGLMNQGSLREVLLLWGGIKLWY